MGKLYTYEWCVAAWNDRATGEYVPIDKPIGNSFCQLFGSPTRGFNFANMNRFPVKTEVLDSGVTYITYFSDSGSANGTVNYDVPIIKITETVVAEA